MKFQFSLILLSTLSVFTAATNPSDTVDLTDSDSEVEVIQVQQEPAASTNPNGAVDLTYSDDEVEVVQGPPVLRSHRRVNVNPNNVCIFSLSNTNSLLRALITLK
jgi:hypothetical protein